MAEKPATIKEIAKILNVSNSTVSRALHKHPSIGLTTRTKVQELARKLHYEPNQTAIFFQKGKTYTIGVILPEVSEAFFSAAINAIEETAYKRNYSILLAQSHDDAEKEKELIVRMKDRRVDGLLVSVAKTTSSVEHFDSLKKYNIPVVFFDRIPPVKNIHYVACNIENGSIDAVNYLLKKGHRRIGMINGPVTLAASTERKNGYMKALISYRMKIDPTFIVNCDLTEHGTSAAFDTLLSNKRKPTAIIVFNDYVYLHAVKRAIDCKIVPGRDLEFASYANLSIINYVNYPPIASVEQFPSLQGQKATDILIDLLAQKVRSPEVPPAYYNVIIDSQLITNG